MSASQLPPLPIDNPFAQRKTVQQLQNQEGSLVQLDAANIGIQSAATGTLLLPVNLPEEFRRAGEQLVFSGSVKEVGLNELFAAPPLVLTEIRKH